MITRLLSSAAFVALALSMASPAAAGTREDAELTRLTDDLTRLADSQIWNGVERRYEQILALEGVQIPMDVHLIAAQSARASGDVGTVLDRLQRAAALSETEEIAAWILDIEENYGQVELVVAGARSAELGAVEMPFAPEQRQQVELAVSALAEEGSFMGMLPVGRYVLEGKEFEVLAGTTTRVDLSMKELRQERRQ